MSKIIIVDENDNPIGIKERRERTDNDIYRITSLWVTDSKGNILLAQRSFTKDTSPGKWGPAVAGTVEEGETYDSNIIKEAREEIGLNLSIEDLTKGEKNLVKKPDGYNYFRQRYYYTIDKPANEFVIQRAEVEKVAWFNPEELRNKVAEQSEEFLLSIQEWAKK